MRDASPSHLVLIPSYNTGPKLLDTVLAARQYWHPVWVVVDGSTDGSAQKLRDMAQHDTALRILVLPENRGKGGAVLYGLDQAVQEGFTHVLCMDADGQHPADYIPTFMRCSQQTPDAMVLGQPIFDDSAPAVRVQGRKLSNWLVNLETLSMGIGDSLFGFRVYPIAPLRQIMNRHRWMRRFDFDPEVAVRLCWHGIHPINLPAPVKYLRPSEGGVSHFNYWRDNLLLTWMHSRLMAGFILRLPILLYRQLKHSKK